MRAHPPMLRGGQDKKEKLGEKKTHDYIVSAGSEKKKKMSTSHLGSQVGEKKGGGLGKSAQA